MGEGERSQVESIYGCSTACSFYKGDCYHFPLTTGPKKMCLMTSVMTRKASMATVGTVVNA